jgi:ketosteroid isomerase-like protein
VRQVLLSTAICAAIAASLVMVSYANEQQSVDAATREVRETLMKYAAAYGANDLDRYFSFFADDMTVWWGTQGRLDDPTPKARYMKTWPDSVKAGGGYHSCELADLRIQAGPDGDAAVASYKLECIRRNPPPGQQPPVTYEMTAVLFKRGGAWKFVHWNWRTADR